MNRQQRRALERKNRKESNPIPNDHLKKLEEILGKPTTFTDADGDLVFSWKRENNDQLEIYFRDDNHIGYHISTGSEMVGGGTGSEKITVIAEAFKSGASGLDLIQLG